MKKDTYPNVKIEIISEGLAKKILGKLENGSPSVYGEEKPTGENLPDIDSKGKNKEMGGLLQVSNKKPTYTSIIKQAILELRKEPEGGSSAPLRRTPEMVRQVASSKAKTTPGKSLLNRRPEV